MAAPQAAGALALLLRTRPSLTPDQQWTALTETAADLGASGTDEVYGYGRLDVLAAFTSLQNAPDNAGPVTDGVLVTPGITSADRPVQVSAEASDVLAGGSDVVAAEYFVDSVGSDTTGTPLVVAAPASVVSLSADWRRPCSLPCRMDRTPVPGVHAQDAAGNWGAAVSAGFVLDTTAPSLSAALATPTPTQGATAVSLTAQAVEAGSGLTRASGLPVPTPALGTVRR